jgi:secreted Zn-dependent insulinase-like peptidase
MHFPFFFQREMLAVDSEFKAQLQEDNTRQTEVCIFWFLLLTDHTQFSYFVCACDVHTVVDTKRRILSTLRASTPYSSHQVIVDTTRMEHPLHKFGWGNFESLKTIPDEKGQSYTLFF